MKNQTIDQRQSVSDTEDPGIHLLLKESDAEDMK